MSSPVRVRDRKRERYLLATGRGLTVRGQEVARIASRVRSFHARGMSFAQMGRQTGKDFHLFVDMAAGERQYVKRRTFDRIRGLKFEPPEPHVLVDSTGARRRLAALWAAGYPLPWLVDRLGFGNRLYFQAILRGTKALSGMEYANVEKLADLYEKIADTDPVTMGVPSHAAKFSRTFAAKKGLAPPGCWDPDTIDDPDAHPEWTGRCGTVFGWRIHQEKGIPVCDRCAAARDSGSLVLSPRLLRASRLDQGLMLTDAARLTGLNVATIQNWEAGRSTPRHPADLEKLLTVLDVTFEDVSTQEEADA